MANDILPQLQLSLIQYPPKKTKQLSETDVLS